MAHQAYITGLESCRWYNEHNKRNNGPPPAHRSQLSLAWDTHSSPTSPATNQIQERTAPRKWHSSVDLSWDRNGSAPSESSYRLAPSRKNQTTADFTSNFSWQATPNGHVKDALRERPERFLKKQSAVTTDSPSPAASSYVMSSTSIPVMSDNGAKPFFRSPLDSRISPTVALSRDGYPVSPESAQLEACSYEESLTNQSNASEQRRRRPRHRAPPQSPSLLDEDVSHYGSDEESVCSQSVVSESIASTQQHMHRRQRTSVTESQLSQIRSSVAESQQSPQMHSSSFLATPVSRPRPGTLGVAPQAKVSRAQRGTKAPTPSVASSSSNAVPARIAPGGELVPPVSLGSENAQQLAPKPWQRSYRRNDSPLPQQLGTPSRLAIDSLSVHSERSVRSSSVDVDQRRRTQGRRCSAASSCSGSETERSSSYWEGSTAPTRSTCREQSFAQPVSC